MQALKNDKDTVGVLRIHPDAVIADREYPFMVTALGRHVDLGRLRPVELDGVDDQVLKERPELSRVGLHLGQIVVSHDGVILLDGQPQRAQHALQQQIAVNLLEIFPLARHPRVGQEVVDQPLHTGGPVYGIADEFICVGVQFALVAPGEQLRVTRHHAQRFL